MTHILLLDCHCLPSEKLMVSCQRGHSSASRGGFSSGGNWSRQGRKEGSVKAQPQTLAPASLPGEGRAAACSARDRGRAACPISVAWQHAMGQGQLSSLQEAGHPSTAATELATQCYAPPPALPKRVQEQGK